MTPVMYHPAPSVVASGQYTGDSADNKAISHALGRIPKRIFVLCASTGGYVAYCGEIVDTLARSWQGTNSTVTQATTTAFYIPNVANCYFNSSTLIYKWVAIG